MDGRTPGVSPGRIGTLAHRIASPLRSNPVSAGLVLTGLLLLQLGALFALYRAGISARQHHIDGLRALLDQTAPGPVTDRAATVTADAVRNQGRTDRLVIALGALSLLSTATLWYVWCRTFGAELLSETGRRRHIWRRLRAAERTGLIPTEFLDPLTGLANRQFFTERLTEVLSDSAEPATPTARRTEEPSADAGNGVPDGLVADARQPRPDASGHIVLLCDLDNFKTVNEGLGHNIGDQVLAILGGRIVSSVRSGDTVARLGGDEFAVLMADTDLSTACTVAERIQAKFAEPVLIDGRTLNLRTSIGLAAAVPGESTSEDALRNADLAMYEAKGHGKSGVALFEPRLHADAVERLQLSEDLSGALDRGEMVLHYQPTVDLATGAVVGFEALVRWNHRNKGLISPDRFIPLAEETGFIVPLGRWVLITACRAAIDLERSGRTPTMSVNVAAAQLAEADFVQQVLGILALTGLAADRLCLEITESTVLTDIDVVTERLIALRQHGIRIAIDDFGTGYSSLAYLSQLPIDVLKVDKSFVDKVIVDANGASLTSAIIAMGRTMNMTTVAEGVEHPEQAAWLASVNCSYGQGYLWSRPISLPDALTLLGAPPAPPQLLAG